MSSASRMIASGSAATPAAVVGRIGAALATATADAVLIARLAEQGVELVSGDAAALRRTLTEDTERWGRVVREGNIRPE